MSLWGARPPFTPADLWSRRIAEDPRITPDGVWVAYVERYGDLAAGAEFSNLWLVSSNGKDRHPLSQGRWRDSSPRWSPDGARLAWLSDRSGSPQIWIAAVKDGMAVQLTSGDRNPRHFAWSPEGDLIAFTALVPGKDAAPAWIPPAMLPRLHQSRQGYVHLFVVPSTGGPSRQVTSGNVDYFGEPAWMLDSHTILMSREGEIFSIAVAGGAAKQLTREGGRNDHPLPSPEGARVAWLAAAEKSQAYGVRKISVMNADGTRVKVLSGTLDRDAVDMQWSSESRTVYFLADDRGSTHVYAARNDGTVRQVTNSPERLSGLSLADNGRAVAVRSTPSEDGGIFTFTVDRVSQPVVLHSPNEHLLAEREIGAQEEIAYPAGANSIQGWIVKPPDFDAARKYPLLLDIRDHPRTMYGVNFDLRAQIFAARGFVVLCVNPRGTPGYGEVFGNLLPTRNPGDDYDDLMAGVEFMAAKPYIDPTRLNVVGGHLSAWTVGHSGRFRSAVVTRLEAPWGAKLWGDAANLKTPTLILAAERDAPADALYSDLRSQKVETALIRLGPPGRIAEQVLELETILAWLTR